MPVLTVPWAYTSLSEWWLTHVGDCPTLFAILVMFLSTEITFWSINLFFYMIECNDWCVKHKIHKEHADREQFRSTLLHKPVTYLVDVPIYWASHQVTKIFHEQPAGPHDALPGAFEIAAHLLACTAAFDFMFYCQHRALHTRLLYRFHKKHHEVKVTYACANDHESVLEVTGNILWKMIPPAVLGSHVYTVCIFRSVVKFFALLHHSGYELPAFQLLQKIPFISSPSQHDFHHYNGQGNYGGVFMFWDYLFGTLRTWNTKARGLGLNATLLETLSERQIVALTKGDYSELPGVALQRLLAEKQMREDDKD